MNQIPADALYNNLSSAIATRLGPKITESVHKVRQDAANDEIESFLTKMEQTLRTLEGSQGTTMPEKTNQELHKLIDLIHSFATEERKTFKEEDAKQATPEALMRFHTKLRKDLGKDVVPPTVIEADDEKGAKPRIIDTSDPLFGTLEGINADLNFLIDEKDGKHQNLTEALNTLVNTVLLTEDQINNKEKIYLLDKLAAMKATDDQLSSAASEMDHVTEEYQHTVQNRVHQHAEVEELKERLNDRNLEVEKLQIEMRKIEGMVEENRISSQHEEQCK